MVGYELFDWARALAPREPLNGRSQGLVSAFQAGFHMSKKLGLCSNDHVYRLLNQGSRVEGRVIRLSMSLYSSRYEESFTINMVSQIPHHKKQARELSYASLERLGVDFCSSPPQYHMRCSWNSL